jgi:TRAP transporter TAXI family solute receptor
MAMNIQKQLFKNFAGTKIAPPLIDRSIRLNLMGDWGRANLHRALGWLSYELVRLSGAHTKIGIWNGRAALDNVRAVGRGEVDVALMTPASFCRMTFDGKAPSGDEPFPHLRALGYVPQDDRMILAVRKELGIRSFDDIRKKRPQLHITAGIDDGIGYMGMAAHAIMRASGIQRHEIEAWGGSFIEHEEPHECIRELASGNANAIFQEAVMTSWWKDLADRNDLAFIPIEPEARDALKKQFGWGSGTLPKGYLRGMDEEMEFLDYSHFLLIATTDLPEDIAYALSWSLVETWDVLESQYRHIPPERSPVTYPLDPKAICRTPIPLHRGAERYFREAGHLT